MGRRDATDRPLIVVDASALVAIAELEPDAPDLLQAIADTESAVISPVNATEAGIVLLSRGRFQSPEGFRNWRSTIAVDLSLEAPDEQAVLAALLRYGKGRHPARLNIGDCFAYALAKRLDAPLLYKGDDFSQTDIRSAL